MNNEDVLEEFERSPQRASFLVGLTFKKAFSVKFEINQISIFLLKTKKQFLNHH